MVKIGEDRSERLDIVPAQFRVLVVRRPRYACRKCEAVVQAPAPARLIEGGLPTEAAVTLILRGRRTIVPDEKTTLAAGDHLLLVTSTRARRLTERREDVGDFPYEPHGETVPPGKVRC